MTNNWLFEEKQYAGFNSYSIARRMVLAIFCFVAFYYTENRMENADLLFLIGIFILIISIVLLFIKFLHIAVDNEKLYLNGMWSSKKIIIPISDIVSAEKTLYSRYHLNNPKFNVHEGNVTQFYSGGKDAVKITLVNDNILLIGTGRADELSNLLNRLANKSAKTSV